MCCVHNLHGICYAKYAQQIRKVSLTSGNEMCNIKPILVKLSTY